MVETAEPTGSGCSGLRAEGTGFGGFVLGSLLNRAYHTARIGQVVSVMAEHVMTIYGLKGHGASDQFLLRG